MDKRELEFNKLVARTRITEGVINLFRTAIICATFLFAIKLIMDGIKSMIGQNASQIEALAKFVQSFRIGSLLAYGLAGIAGVAWFFERRGKQRAIREKARYQAKAEGGEPNRSSSGLTQIGHTPK